MRDNQIESLLILAQKEDLLSKIIVWLKTKGLYEECLNIVAPHLIAEPTQEKGKEI